MNQKYLLKEMGYVCEPPILSIKLVYNCTLGEVTVDFYNGNTISFSLAQKMNVSDKRDEYDEAMGFILTTIFEMYPRDLFQDVILEGDIQGLNFYDSLQVVRNKLGTPIWTRP